MKIEIEVVHQIKGRARIKVKSPFEPSTFLMVIGAVLKEIEDVKRFELNQLAMSVTIYFKSHIDLNAILAKLNDILLEVTADPSFNECMSELQDTSRYAHLDDACVTVRGKILELSHPTDGNARNVPGTGAGITSMKTIVPAAALTAGVATLALAPALATPAWLVLLAFSFTSYNQLNGRGGNPYPGISSPHQRLISEPTEAPPHEAPLHEA